ncbi:MAG TPA: FHA domain-containing protein [Myxococcota bacterium]|nr:FHA domain-containing protein [Myxococcota bacterium]HQK51534.1 FHA domain-containing protein [Myxococcota bacterium]
MIRCVHCGTENEEIFSYCLNCGKPLEQSLKGFKPRQSPSRGPGSVLIAIRSDGTRGNEIPLSDGTNHLGRTGPEVTIPDDPRVVDRHAVLEVGRDVVFLEDLGSPHGTWIRVTGQRTLTDGDQIRIGHAFFQVELNPAKAPASVDGAAPLGSLGGPTEFHGRLLRLGPGDVVMEAHLLRVPETTLGRTTGDILLPDDPFVSSRHAAFAISGASCLLKDQGSTNGCFLRVRGRVAIQDGDFLLLGHHLFQFKQVVRPA